MFLPTTTAELNSLGWTGLDIILITGDTYIDSPFIGTALIGKVLLAAGFRVGIIAQPATDSADDISRLGEPELFWGVSGGGFDSMVANYTASGKHRHQDDLTPGGRNNRRPDRAVIVYTNLIRRYFKQTRPIILGGIEASLRRLAHYDFWSNSIRRSVLFDAKGDYLMYGMGENSMVELASRLQAQKPVEDIRGL
ncbi:MAG: YgiQ family radical SAM protein, partial [Deltaproteobacteria bacterium]|nr:YgiQ family radical SAM protein [Deltaproteobacteria bacterium]